MGGGFSIAEEGGKRNYAERRYGQEDEKPEKSIDCPLGVLDQKGKKKKKRSSLCLAAERGGAGRKPFH